MGHKMENRKEILKNLSSNNYIEELWEKYYLSVNVEKYNELWEELWKHIEQQKNIRCIKDFYLSIIGYFTNMIKTKILGLHIEIPINEIIYHIVDYYGYNFAVMSDKIMEKAYEIFKQKEESWEDFFFFLTYHKNVFFSLLSNFPLWKYNLAHFLCSTTCYLNEVFEKMEKDFEEIKDLFSTQNLTIKNIYLEQGDRHHDSFVIKFETNCGYLFYKPRSNDIGKAFENINNRLTGLENSILDMKFPIYYGSENYSWVRGISYKPIKNKNEEKNYYKRIGQLLALFYILDGNDMHYENLISEGEYPIPIDIETLFSTKLFLNKCSNSSLISESEINYTTTSVKNIGFIPTFLKVGDKTYDISSINIEDEINQSNKKSHLHKAGKCFLNLDEIEDEVMRGFRNVYWTFTNNKDILVPFIFKTVSGLKIRYLNHMTAEYGIIKDSILKPICFYNPQYAFAITARIFNYNKDPGEVELYEQEELLNLNIPYFKVEIANGNLILNDDRAIKSFFRKSPWELFEEKVKYLGKNDFEFQIAVIKKLFSARKGIVLHEVKDFINICNTNKCEDIRKVKKDIFKYILDNSNKNPINEEHTWIEYQLSGSHYEVVNVPNNFYSGLFGLVKAFVSDNNVPLENDIKVYISEALSLVKKVIKSDISGMLTGAYEGIGVYINFLKDMVNLNIIQKKEYDNSMSNLLNKCIEIYENDVKIDVLNGNAGLIVSLLHALKNERNDELKEQILTVIKCVKDKVISNIICRNKEYYFPVDGRTTTYFNGYAHGSAGITVAIYKAMKILKEEDHDLIKKLLDTQRLHFNKEKGIWYNDNKHRKSSWGWCHGIPGILLSRLELIQNGYYDEKIEDEIDILMQLSFENALGYNTTFCHGDMAIITILQFAIEMGYCNQLKEKIEEYNHMFINNILLKWNMYSVRGTEVIGIMDGLAGIVYYLSCYEQNKLPIDVLTIDNGGTK